MKLDEKTKLGIVLILPVDGLEMVEDTLNSMQAPYIAYYSVLYHFIVFQG